MGNTHTTPGRHNTHVNGHGQYKTSKALHGGGQHQRGQARLIRMEAGPGFWEEWLPFPGEAVSGWF